MRRTALEPSRRGISRVIINAPSSSRLPSSTPSPAGQPPNAKETIYAPILETSKHRPSFSAISSDSFEHRLDKPLVYPVTALTPLHAPTPFSLLSTHNVNLYCNIDNDATPTVSHLISTLRKSSVQTNASTPSTITTKTLPP